MLTRYFMKSSITNYSKQKLNFTLAPLPSNIDLIEVFVDDKAIKVPRGTTVLNACELGGVEIPRFCYHERLNISGNCRMCLVEIEKAPKPVASCAFPVGPGMKIKTNTPLVAKAREGVMEFLLINHPLDCPICDQGGECDLQDQAYVFGSDVSRFREAKRSVEDKNYGPLVKTVMTRCIHCTRCVRFATEVAGVPDLGATGRGNNMEIGSYVEKFFDSEVSGNVIDLCPVGALTSKPYAFTARPWELRHVESIDVTDAIGANIRVDVRGKDVMRVIPRVNDYVNEEWISDKARFSYDGLKRQRLDFPLIRNGANFVPVDWRQAFDTIANNLNAVKGSEIAALVGDDVDAEAMVSLKDLMNKLGSSSLYSRSALCADVRSDYIMNSGLTGIDSADALLMIGTNPRMEAPLFNVRVRKAVIHRSISVGLVGPKSNLTYAHSHLGDDVAVLNQIADGKHPFCKVLARATKPMIVVNAASLNSAEGPAIQAALDRISENINLVSDSWNGLNVLQAGAANTAALDIGFTPGLNSTPLNQAKFVYLLGADDALPSGENIFHPDAFVVYQGHHGDKGALLADVVLPGSAYTEKDGLFVNTDGRVQTTRAATNAPEAAREDWRILVALGDRVGKTLPYKSLQDVRSRLVEVAPHFSQIGDRIAPSNISTSLLRKSEVLSKDAKFSRVLDNFFMTDAISRASKTMAKATKDLKVASNSYL